MRWANTANFLNHEYLDDLEKDLRALSKSKTRTKIQSNFRHLQLRKKNYQHLISQEVYCSRAVEKIYFTSSFLPKISLIKSDILVGLKPIR